MIDTHTHLTEEPLCADVHGVLERARACGVTRWIVPGYNAASWRRARELAAQHTGVFIAAGLHPLFLGEAEISDLGNEVKAGGLVAVGEIGLDHSERNADRERQMRFFTVQLERARTARLPVIIHCRNAYDVLLRVLQAFPGVRGVLHSCSCSHEQIRPFLALGWHVSFSGVVTRDRSLKARRLAEHVPLERMLVETDSPYIGTRQHPSGAVEPAHLVEVIGALAAIKGCSVDAMAAATTRNAEDLFQLTASPGRASARHG